MTNRGALASSVLVLGLVLAACSGQDSIAVAAVAICDAIDAEASDEIAFAEFERAVARERRDGLDEGELRAAVDERCGRAVTAISALDADPDPPPQEEEQDEPDPVDLGEVDWASQAWATTCAVDDDFSFPDDPVEVVLEPADESDGSWWGYAHPDTPVPRFSVDLDEVLRADVTGDGADGAVFRAECIPGNFVQPMLVVWTVSGGLLMQLPEIRMGSDRAVVLDRYEVVEGAIRAETGEPAPGAPPADGYPVEVVTDWGFDGVAWVPTEVSRTDTTPQPEPEGQGTSPSSSVPACQDAAASQSNAAQCLYAAVEAGNPTEAANVTSPSAIEAMYGASLYEGFTRWEFTGCGEPILLDPPTGVSCTFYEPPIDWPHGVVVELGMGARDGGAYIEELGYVG